MKLLIEGFRHYGPYQRILPIPLSEKRPTYLRHPHASADSTNDESADGTEGAPSSSQQMLATKVIQGLIHIVSWSYIYR